MEEIKKPNRDYMKLTPNEKRFKCYILTPRERREINNIERSKKDRVLR